MTPPSKKSMVIQNVSPIPLNFSSLDKKLPSPEKEVPQVVPKINLPICSSLVGDFSSPMGSLFDETSILQTSFDISPSSMSILAGLSSPFASPTIKKLNLSKIRSISPKVVKKQTGVFGFENTFNISSSEMIDEMFDSKIVKNSLHVKQPVRVQKKPCKFVMTLTSRFT